MELPQRGLLANNTRRTSERASKPRSADTPQPLLQLALVLLAELGACVQMITSDLAQHRNLAAASVRWKDELESLTAIIERQAVHAGSPPESHRNVSRCRRQQPALATVAPLVLNIGNDAVNSPMDSMRPDNIIPTPRVISARSTRTSVSGASAQHTVSGVLGSLDSTAQVSRLTAREREIMKLARRGVPPHAIARRLQLSVQTVYTHQRNARRKTAMT